jgi:hypothetical protein
VSPVIDAATAEFITTRRRRTAIINVVTVTGPEHVAIPLNCHHCGGPIEIACEVSDDGSTQSVRFTCPYCGTPREFQAPGRVLWVAMRQLGEGPETRH